jgi:glucose-1-phosphatase
MIRAFLFDIGNVIVRFDFSKCLRAIAQQCDARDEADALARMDADKLLYEDGQMARAEFLRRTFAQLGYRGDEAGFISTWQNIFTPNEPMHALIRRLHGQFPLYLLSNTNDMHVEGLHRDFPVFACFSGGTYSHDVSASKPDRRIYEIACKAHDLTPETTFFIDDMEPNIATARSLGFVAHHYHPDQHDRLLADLAKHVPALE